MPVIVTTVPCCPIVGDTSSILGSSRYSHAEAFSTNAPVSASMYTEPTPASALSAACTWMCVSLLDTTAFTSIPASLTIPALLPPPSMSVPVIHTYAPPCPLAGDTSVMLPSSK